MEYGRGFRRGPRLHRQDCIGDGRFPQVAARGLSCLYELRSSLSGSGSGRPAPAEAGGHLHELQGLARSARESPSRDQRASRAPRASIGRPYTDDAADSFVCFCHGGPPLELMVSAMATLLHALCASARFKHRGCMLALLRAIGMRKTHNLWCLGYGAIAEPGTAFVLRRLGLNAPVTLRAAIAVGFACSMRESPVGHRIDESATRPLEGCRTEGMVDVRPVLRCRVVTALKAAAARAAKAFAGTGPLGALPSSCLPPRASQLQQKECGHLCMCLRMCMCLILCMCPCLNCCVRERMQP